MARKPAEERSSEMLLLRVRPDLRRELKRLKDETGQSVASHVVRAIDQYLDRMQRAPHIERLSDEVAQLAENVERVTERKWTKDTFTAEAIREALAQLFLAFVSDDTKIKEFIPPKLAKEFAAAKRRITPKLIGKREAMALLREAWASTKPEDRWRMFRFQGRMKR